MLYVLACMQDVKAFLDLEWLDVPPSWKFLDTQLVAFAVCDYLSGLPAALKPVMEHLPCDRGRLGGEAMEGSMEAIVIGEEQQLLAAPEPAGHCFCMILKLKVLIGSFCVALSPERPSLMGQLVLGNMVIWFRYHLT
jgi:hypothetical protein